MRHDVVTQSRFVAASIPARDTILRWLMAGPLTLLAAVVMMASMPLWLPVGSAGIDNLIFPILLFPAFWAGFFLYSLIEARPVRGIGIIMAIIIVNAALIFSRF